MPPQITHEVGIPRSDLGIAPYGYADTRWAKTLPNRETTPVGRHPLMPPQFTHEVGILRSDLGIAPYGGGVPLQEHPVRKWPRLKEFDYSSEGFFYLTICTEGRKCLLSTITANERDEPVIMLTEYGQAAETYLKSIPGILTYVIMPNHIHLILHKTNGKPIASDVRSFKGLVTKKIGKSIWQDYYYDHVIRDEEDFQIKWNYINSNPAKWVEDKYHP